MHSLSERPCVRSQPGVGGTSGYSLTLYCMLRLCAEINCTFSLTFI